MATFLLLLIYLAFIGLGLPDPLLGTAWPLMHIELGVAVSSAGILTFIITGGTVVSSLSTDYLVRKLGTGLLTTVSVGMTAAAVLGFSFSHSFVWLVLLAVPYGLGAGAVDAALNNYIALHYGPQHMSWLHCFWGIGAFSGPIIMSYFLRQENWRSGYLTVGIALAAIALLLTLSIPLWRRAECTGKSTPESGDAVPIPSGENRSQPMLVLLRMRGMLPGLGTMLLYCGVEYAMNCWGSSFLVSERALVPDTAAAWVSTFFLGITAGRLLSGFAVMKMSSKMLIRVGQVMLTCGAVLLLLPVGGYMTLAGFIVVGLGCAPIYPSIIHETPARFGRRSSQKIIGIQMACAYVGSMLIPPVLGFIAVRVGFGILPVWVLVSAVLMLVLSERLNIVVAKHPISE